MKEINILCVCVRERERERERDRQSVSVSVSVFSGHLGKCSNNKLHLMEFEVLVGCDAM